MKWDHFIFRENGRLIRDSVATLILILSNQVFAVCDQTLSVGGNIAAAVGAAPAGTILCLNAGNYGLINLNGISKSTPVTIQSSSGRTAIVNFEITNSSQIKLSSLTISGLSLHHYAKNILISGNSFTGQMVVNMGSNGGSYGNANIVIDGNTFDGISVCTDCYEGRLQILSDLPSGVTIVNNHFGGGGESDGIQLGANGVVIGPGNVFEGILQGNYGRHIDSIQGYGQSNTTIVGNYFVNNTIYIGMYDGGSNETISNNVFGPSGAGGQLLQLGSIQGLTFTHNTLKGDFVVAQGAKFGDARNTNAVYRNNVLVGVSIADTGDQPGCASGCVYEYNLFSASNLARGVSNIIGLPTFLGGSNPTSWPGYQLTAGSLGHLAASDGKDLGATSFGSTPLPPPPSLTAPRNLRLQ